MFSFLRPRDDDNITQHSTILFQRELFVRVVMPVLKVAFVIGAAIACAALARRFGPLKAIGLWAGLMAALCAGVAMILHRQTPEKVTPANYLAGFVLQWGYRVGRGKLPAIVVVSWAIWLLLGVAMVVSVHFRGFGQPAAQQQRRSTLVMVLLTVAWVIDGTVLLRIIGLLATGPNARHMLRSLGPVAAVLVGMIGSSIVLVARTPSVNASRLALLIAGGPLLFVGVGYGLFVLVLLTAGKNARWN
jgi:hypothetical protein